MRPCWQSGRLTPLLAQPTQRELLRVLAYPKFRLDPHDQVFLDLALAAEASALVSGDADLRALQGCTNPLLIFSSADLQTWLDASI